jgi:hypothetical protein
VNRYADYETLRSISSSLSSLNSATLARVVVWKANANNTLPSACDIAVPPTGVGPYGSPGLCNVYSPAQVGQGYTSVGFPPTSSTSPTCTSTSWDTNWCPTGRANSTGSGDYVGIYIEIRYTSVTKTLPWTGLAIKRSAIYRIEPPHVGG